MKMGEGKNFTFCLWILSWDNLKNLSRVYVLDGNVYQWLFLDFYGYTLVALKGALITDRYTPKYLGTIGPPHWNFWAKEETLETILGLIKLGSLECCTFGFGAFGGAEFEEADYADTTIKLAEVTLSGSELL